MNEDLLKAVDFWDIIEMSRKENSVNEQKEFLISHLNSYGSYFTLLFDLSLRQKIRALFFMPTYELVKLIAIVASEEDIFDFCCFVILQGKKAYEAFILEPHTIIDALLKLDTPIDLYGYNIIRLTDEAFKKDVKPNDDQEFKLLYPYTIGQMIFPLDPDFEEVDSSDEYFTYLKEKYKRLADSLER
ncbi:MAG: DUF4240 domain-containing protein [Bacteroidota bacterium]